MMPDRLALPGLRQMVRDANTLVADATSTLTGEDVGLYGPRSVTWRLRQDATYNVAGLRALLVQAVTGRSHRADDQDLLLWVHNAQVDSELATWNTFHRALAPVDADRFIREQVASAELIGIDPHIVPTTHVDLADYTAAAPTRMTAAAKAFGQSLLTATMPITVRPVWFQHLAATVATLPDGLRDQYGFPRWLPTGRVSRAAQRINFRATQLAFAALPGVRASRRTLRHMSTPTAPHN